MIAARGGLIIKKCAALEESPIGRDGLIPRHDPAGGLKRAK